jgi:hypothetical protein
VKRKASKKVTATPDEERSPGWLYVDGMPPADIGRIHGITVAEVLVYAGRLGVPERLLYRDGLGRGGRSIEDERREVPPREDPAFGASRQLEAVE